MWKTEIIIFIILGNLVFLIFIVGIIIFIFQYRKRKLIYQKEKADLEKQHRLDLLHAQLQARHQTMQYIGSEIHDSVAQKLTLASIYSQKLEFENHHPEISAKLAGISGIINDSLTELRDLSRTLVDSRVQDTSFTDLLHIECDRVNAVGDCKAELDQDFQNEISVTVKSFLLRVVQEFIQNSLKHAACSVIRIKLSEKEKGLHALLSDNGKGFNTGQMQSKGTGLGNMKRRVHLIGGNFNIYSEPGTGTRVELFIPSEKLLSS